MNFQNLISEIKRRNVHRVSTVYAVTGWLIIQVVATIKEPLNLPDKFDTITIILVAVGLPIAVIIAWVFELTPTGIKKTNETQVSEGFNELTKRKLNRVTIAILALVLSLVVFERVFLVGSGFYEEASLSEAVTQQEKSVVVLPFSDFSPEGDQEWFADGLTDELLNSLSRVSELRVIARTTSFALKGKELSVQKIADSLNVNYLVEGSIRKAGNKIKVTAQLIDPKLDDHIWSNTFEKDFVDIFDIQQSIAEGISDALNIYFDDEVREDMFSIGTKNADAYEAYLRGNEYFNLAHSDQKGGTDNLIKYLDTANVYYQNATRLDPNFAAVYYKHQDLYMHYLIHRPDLRPENLSEIQVVDIAKKDISMAQKMARTRGEQIFYELENATISNDWSSVPALLDELESKEEYLKEMSRLGLGWTNGLLILLDREDIGLKILGHALLSDPLNKSTRPFIYTYLTAQNELDSARAWNKKELNNEQDLMWELTHAPEKFDEIIPLIESSSEGGFMKFFLSIINNTVDQAEFDAEINRISQLDEYYTCILYVAKGELDKADSIATIIDASFLSSTKISDRLNLFAGKIPFRLSATPNFSARLKEAGITDLVAYEKEHRLKFGK